MKAYWGMEIDIHAFLTSALDGMNGQLHFPAARRSGKELAVPTKEEAQWVPVLVWTLEKRRFFAVAQPR